MAELNGLNGDSEDADGEVVDKLRAIRGKFREIHDRFTEIGSLVGSYKSGHGGKGVPPPILSAEDQTVTEFQV